MDITADDFIDGGLDVLNKTLIPITDVKNTNGKVTGTVENVKIIVGVQGKLATEKKGNAMVKTAKRLFFRIRDEINQEIDDDIAKGMIESFKTHGLNMEIKMSVIIPILIDIFGDEEVFDLVTKNIQGVEYIPEGKSVPTTLRLNQPTTYDNLAGSFKDGTSFTVVLLAVFLLMLKGQLSGFFTNILSQFLSVEQTSPRSLSVKDQETETKPPLAE